MKSYFASFLFFALMGCSTSSLSLSPTKYSYVGQSRTKQLDQENPQLHPAITLKEIRQSLWGRKAVLEIQGWYSSQGHQARRLKQIKWIQEIEGNQLTFVCYVEPKRGVGKESAHVYGYNYNQEISISIPSTIEQLNVTLIEQNIAQDDMVSYQSHIQLDNTK
ncbi:hypothetical protein H4K35_08440 [Myroides sp. NP-2]|uniref:hypothetical protein n=1 Tax=Myroides sp. NP-2 TaxID=2759945 RepID=UPI0015FAD094|nr:hypothetical protein [Myroides sp. NP-2]